MDQHDKLCPLKLGYGVGTIFLGHVSKFLKFAHGFGDFK